MKKILSRRSFINVSLGAAASCTALRSYTAMSAAPVEMKLGLVTYLWGKDWDLATLIDNCAQSGVLGIEPRTTHKHGIEIAMTPAQRVEAKKMLDDSPVILAGIGSDERFDNPNPAVLKKAMDTTREFIKLSHDVGGSGVKVKPDSFHNSTPHEQTLEQIGKSLGSLGNYAKDLGQELRLEVHGKVGQEIENIKKIMEIADHSAVRVCWNCNGDELKAPGLEHYFDLLKNYFGNTVHVRELNIGDYPYQQLINLFVKMNYTGWILLECRTAPVDRVAAMKEQLSVWKDMVRKARQS